MQNSTYIIAQIIGMVAFIVSLVAYHKNKKEKILGSMILSNTLNLIHYLLLGAFSGCITKVIGIFRDLFIIIKEKKKINCTKAFLGIFLIIYFIAALLTYKGSILSLFPIFAAIIYIVPIWNGNEVTVKRSAFICYTLWLIYNIFVFSIAGIISNIIAMISTFIAIKNVNNLY